MGNNTQWPLLHNESTNWGSNPADICGPGREDGSDYAPWLRVHYGSGSYQCPETMAFSNEVLRRWNSHDALVEALRGIAGYPNKPCWCGDGCDTCYPCMARAALAQVEGK